MLRKDKPWFGPSPVANPMTGLRSPFWPRTWQGVVVFVVFLVGLGPLTKMVHDPIRGPIAALLWIAAFAAIVFLTWGSDPD